MIIVMGTPGAGKTTILKHLTEYRVITYSDVMLEVVKKWGVADRDEIRKLPPEKQKEAQKEVFERLAKMEKIILDTHCSINTPSGYLPGLPFEHLKKLKVECLIFIYATPEEIAKRREKDKSRRRDRDDIAMHDAMNKAYLAAYSAFTGAPACIIHNKEGALEESVKKVREVIKRVWAT